MAQARLARIGELEAEVRLANERAARIVGVARERAEDIVAGCEALIGGVIEANRVEEDSVNQPVTDADMGGEPSIESVGDAAMAEGDPQYLMSDPSKDSSTETSSYET